VWYKPAAAMLTVFRFARVLDARCSMLDARL
jgi:hypothetical protein